MKVLTTGAPGVELVEIGHLIPAVSVLGLHDGLVHCAGLQRPNHIGGLMAAVGAHVADRRRLGVGGENDVVPLARRLVGLVHLHAPPQQTHLVQRRPAGHHPAQVVELSAAAERLRQEFDGARPP